MHVVESMLTAFGGDVPMDLSELQQQQFDQAQKLMTKLFDKHPELNPGDSHLVFGQPRLEIIQLAKDKRVDLIVVGERGRHGMSLLRGSTSNERPAGVPCDVQRVP